MVSKRALRAIVMSFALALALMASAAPASADEPVQGCPQGAWELSVFPATAPAAGANWHWDATLAGLTSEFGSVAAGLAALGFADLSTLYDVVLAGVDRVDKNGDRAYCSKPFPEQGSVAAFFLNAVDNQSSSPQ